MKRYWIFIISLLLCAYPAGAVSYSTPYQAFSSGYAQAPQAAMRSTSSMLRSTTRSTTPRGMYTSATHVKGGMTAGQTYAAMTGAQRVGARKLGEHPEHNGVDLCTGCVDANGDFICDVCGHDIYECECDSCRCPIGEGWQVWLFMGILASSYAAHKAYARKKKKNTVYA